MTDRIIEVLERLWIRAYDRDSNDLYTLFVLQDAMSALEFPTRYTSRKIWKKTYDLLFIQK